MNATTMKQAFPIKFGDTAVPFPLTWEEQHNNISRTVLTEDGTDHVIYTRKGKLLVSASWKCTDGWAKTFREFAREDIFTLTVYDQRLKAYQTHDVRITEFSCNLVRHSWNTFASYGLWEINLTIEEF